MGRRRRKKEVERDNIEYLLRKNASIIDEALELYDGMVEYEDYDNPDDKYGVGRHQSFARQKVDLEGGRFSFEGKNYGEVVAELTRINDFLSSMRRNVQNAKEQEAKFLFIFKKGEYTKEKAKKYLDEDVAKRAYRAYRDIEADRANEIVGDGGYGSDNLISYLYSMELQGYNSGKYGQQLLNKVERDKMLETNELEDLIFMPRNVTRASLRAKRRGDLYEREW